MTRIVSAGLLLASALAVTPAAASTLLHQSFDYAGPTQDEALRAPSVGWCGGNAGDTFCGNSPGTIANQGGEGAVSTGNGVGGTQGFAFWSQTGINADSFLYTHIVSFETQEAGTRLSWFQSDSDPVGTRIALLSGSSWYISDQVFSYVRNFTGDWGALSAVVEDLTYFQRDTGGNPSVLPGGGVGTGGLSLTLGATVDALGFWWDGPKSNTSRIDEVSLAPVPVPGALPLLIAALVGLIWFGRRGRETA